MLVPSTIGEALGLQPDVRRHRRPRRGHRGRHGVAGGGRHPRRPGPRRAVPDRRPPPAPRRAGAAPAQRGQSLGRDTSAWAEFEVPFGNVGANVGYAMIANRYLHEHDATPEQLAKIAVHQRDNACRNPDAWFYGQPITVDDVLDSPMVADPLHLLEIVMPSAGAAALVVVHPDLVRRRAARPPGCSAPASASPTRRSPTPRRLTDTAIRPAADRAFAQAGVDPRAGRAGLAVRLLHDHRAGHAGGGRLLRAGRRRGASSTSTTCAGTATSRSTPTAASSASASPGLAGGMSHVTEAVRQVQGAAATARSRDLEMAFVNGNGGIMSEECALRAGGRAVSRPRPGAVADDAAVLGGTGRRALPASSAARSCGTPQFYPRPTCTDLRVGRRSTGRRPSGGATLHTFTVARRPTHPAFDGDRALRRRHRRARRGPAGHRQRRRLRRRRRARRHAARADLGRTGRRRLPPPALGAALTPRQAQDRCPARCTHERRLNRPSACVEARILGSPVPWIPVVSSVKPTAAVPTAATLLQSAAHPHTPARTSHHCRPTREVPRGGTGGGRLGVEGRSAGQAQGR